MITQLEQQKPKSDFLKRQKAVILFPAIYF